MSDQPLDAAQDPDARDRLRDKLAAIRQRFIEGFDHKLAELVSLARVVETGSAADRDAARDALGRGLHSLAGSGPTIGLTALGAKARELEVQLARAAMTGHAPGGDFREGLAALASLARSDAT